MNNLNTRPFAGSLPLSEKFAKLREGVFWRSVKSHYLGSRIGTTLLLLGDAMVMLFSAYIAQWTGGSNGTALQASPLTDVGLYLACCWSAGAYKNFECRPVERLRVRAVAMGTYIAVKLILTGLGVLILTVVVALIIEFVLVFIAGYYAESAIRAMLISCGFFRGAAVIVGGDPRVVAATTLRAPEQGLIPLAIADLETHDSSLGAKRASNPHILRSQRDLECAAAETLCASIETPRDVEPLKKAILDELEHLHPLLLENSSAAALMPPRVGMWAGQTAFDPGAWTPQQRFHRLVKRMIDLIVVLPASIVALPIVGLLAVVIKLADGGPVIFRQHRVGEGDKLVTIYKLRSMYKDAEDRLESYLKENPMMRAEWENGFKLGHDPRILPKVGDFIRRWSLDELPQLWNVIRGDMSLIGPRPFPSYHINKFDEKFRRVRASVPPGLTGLWQVSARSNSDLATQRAYDLYYIENWSLWLDLYVLLETFTAVLSARGAR